MIWTAQFLPFCTQAPDGHNLNPDGQLVWSLHFSMDDLQLPSEHRIYLSDGQINYDGQFIRSLAQVPSEHLIGLSDGHCLILLFISGQSSILSTQLLS